MKQTNKVAAESRNHDHLSSTGERPIAKANENGLGAAMVDALEDIMKWERASERSMKVASKAS